MRIYQISIKLNISHNSIIKFLRKYRNIDYNHMSLISTRTYDRIVKAYNEDKTNFEVMTSEKWIKYQSSVGNYQIKSQQK